MRLNNFKRYKTEKVDHRSVAYLKDDEGNDWYDICSEFQAETLKILFDAEGLIRSFNTDASILSPEGLSITEVSIADVPSDFFDGGKWVFDGDKITEYVPTTEELAEQAAAEKSRRLDEALQVIIPLQIAVKHNMATDTEKAQLDAWEKYSVLLNRVDTVNAGETKFPKVPMETR